MPKRKRVLLDTDANNEIDDQHAIAYLLLNGNHFQVEGITVNRTNNGGDIGDQAREAERIIQLCNLNHRLPVILGASASFSEIEPHLLDNYFDGAPAVDLIITRARRESSNKLILLAIGKLTNVALALKLAPDIIEKVTVVWLGSNFPDPGEYNLDNDIESMNYILDTEVEFEMAVVRYFADSGTSAVRVTLSDIAANAAGHGPIASTPIWGRNGGEFDNFGDYSLNLFQNVRMSGSPPSRALYDMAVVAILKNPSWAERSMIPAPTYFRGTWELRGRNRRKIAIWENFDRQAIIEDFYRTLTNFRLAEVL